jgi:hypothetical protein
MKVAWFQAAKTFENRVHVAFTFAVGRQEPAENLIASRPDQAARRGGTFLRVGSDCCP